MASPGSAKLPNPERPRRSRGSRRALALAGLALAVATAGHAHPGSGIAVDARGNVYFVDTGDGVWRLAPDGRLERYGGPAFHWMALDPVGAYAGSSLPRTPNSEMRSTGSDPGVVLSSDFPIAIAGGALWFAEPDASERLTLVGIRADGARRELAELPASTASGRLRWINGIAAGADGSILFTDDRAVHRVGADGRLVTLARDVRVEGCTPVAGYREELLPGLRGLAEGPDGVIWVAASGCGALLRWAPDAADGAVTVALRAEPPWSPTAVVVAADGGVLVLEYTHTASEDDDRRLWIPRVRRRAPDGTVTSVATVDRQASPAGRR